MNPTNLKTGDILHCTGNKFISRAIMKLTKSKFSHTALFIEIWGQPYVIDAQKDGVNLRPWDAWREQYNYTFIAHRSPDGELDRIALSKRALTKVGHTAYDFESLIFRHPMQIATGKWEDKKDPYEKMTCSEYVMWVYGMEKAYRISPENVYRWCVMNSFGEVAI
jgi:uncharacterized protein YycO